MGVGFLAEIDGTGAKDRGRRPRHGRPGHSRLPPLQDVVQVEWKRHQLLPCSRRVAPERGSSTIPSEARAVMPHPTRSPGFRSHAESCQKVRRRGLDSRRRFLLGSLQPPDDGVSAFERWHPARLRCRNGASKSSATCRDDVLGLDPSETPGSRDTLADFGSAHRSGEQRYRQPPVLVVGLTHGRRRVPPRGPRCNTSPTWTSGTPW